MIKITTSLMCASQLHLYRDIHSLLKAGIDMFHFDIMDGEFVDNLALTSGLFNKYGFNSNLEMLKQRDQIISGGKSCLL